MKPSYGYCARVLATRSSFLLVGLIAISSLLPVGTAVGQEYPSRPIRLIVPFPPGNFSDSGARLAAQHLSDQMGQPMVVDNRPGAGGTIGTEAVSRAAPDGYTLVLGTASTLAVAPHVFRVQKYDPRRAFAPISMILTMPLTFVTRIGLPVTSVKELAAYGREKKGVLNFGSAGKGTQVHLAAEQFTQIAGIKATDVPFQGGAPAMTALLAGTVDYVFDLPVSSAPHYRAGKIRVLAVTSRERVPMLPDVPTSAEAGMPQLNITAWMGLLGPAGMPAEAVKRIDSEMRKALATKDMLQALANMGAMPAVAGPKEFADLISREYDSYADIVRRAGIEPE